MLNALYPKKNFEYFLVTNFESLKKYNKLRHKVIIFDDVAFSSFSKHDRSTEMNHIFGSGPLVSAIRILFGTVDIAPYTISIRIFTINDIRRLIPDDLNLLQRVALLYIRNPFDFDAMENSLPYDDNSNYYLNYEDFQLYPYNAYFIKDFEKMKKKAFHDNIADTIPPHFSNNIDTNGDVLNINNINNINNNINNTTNNITIKIELSENNEVNLESLKQLQEVLKGFYYSPMRVFPEISPEDEMINRYNQIVLYQKEALLKRKKKEKDWLKKHKNR